MAPTVLELIWKMAAQVLVQHTLSMALTSPSLIKPSDENWWWHPLHQLKHLWRHLPVELNNMWRHLTDWRNRKIIYIFVIDISEILVILVMIICWSWRCRKGTRGGPATSSARRGILMVSALMTSYSGPMCWMRTSQKCSRETIALTVTVLMTVPMMKMAVILMMTWRWIRRS